MNSRTRHPWDRYGEITNNKTGAMTRWRVQGRPQFITGDTVEVETGSADRQKSTGSQVTPTVRVIHRPPPSKRRASRDRRSVSVAPEPTPHTLIAVSITYADDAAEHWCNDTCTANLMWGPPPSVRTLYLDSSYGQIDFVQAGSRTVAVTIAGSSFNQSCPYYEIGEAANAALAAADIDVWGYDHRTYYIPDGIECSWGGLAEVGGGNSWMYSSTGPILAHELGHNLGMSHSSTDDNNDGQIESEYGDTGDIMGGASGWHHLTAPHRRQLG
jgi:hypothetical protein